MSDPGSDERPSFTVREKRRFREGIKPDSSTAEAAADAPPAEAAPTAADSGQAGETSEPLQTAGPAQEAGNEQSAEVNDPNTEARAESEQETEQENDGMPEITIHGILQFTTSTLSQLAWQNLGLLPNPATGKVAANLGEARLAIDAFGALVPVISPMMDDSSRREMQNLLATLRLNFVEQTKRQASQ